MLHERKPEFSYQNHIMMLSTTLYMDLNGEKQSIRR